MTKKERRHRAAKKGARTRAANRAMWKRYREVDKPAMDKITHLLNYLLRRLPKRLSLRWIGEYRLRLGAQYAELVRVESPTLLRVLIEGQKHPKVFHARYWEVLLP